MPEELYSIANIKTGEIKMQAFSSVFDERPENRGVQGLYICEKVRKRVIEVIR